ncbi:MAG TPA: amidase [Ramlibacter sp.]|nr:amidase [Ramlibacter sp.]
MTTAISDTAAQLAHAIRSRECSALELVQALLARIERRNPGLNAVVTLDAEGALERASAADAALARGRPCGPLHGVPFTLKDCFETAGLRTTAGYPPLAAHVPQTDSTVAARLKAAGAILLGKTNVPPLAMSLQTNNEIFGRSNNPWDLERTTGGSSGGGAAAVAAGLVPFDVGSDLSGSIRIPAHFCGVYGFKPTSNRVPGTGHVPPPPGAPRMDRQLCAYGPLARSVDDLALLMPLLAGPDGLDTEVPPLPWRAVPQREVAQLRIVWRSAWPGVPTARAVRAAVERVARCLADAGAQVEEGDPGFSRDELMAVWNDYFALASAAMTEVAGVSLPVKPPPGAPGGLAAWIGVQHRRDALLQAIDRTLSQRFDAFLCPAVITNAFVHSAPRMPFMLDGESVDSRFADHYLFPFNLLGTPAVVLPAGLAADGLPVGVQLVGARWRDEELLATARAVDGVVGGFRAPPDPAG